MLEVSYHGSSITNCFPTFDGNGNVSALVNAADGTLAANYEYGPFGEVIRSTGPMAKINPFRFSTKYQDDESDLLYYGYRYYKPSAGIWLSRDPIQERGGKNLYVFARNDAINHYDKYGEFPNPVSPAPPPPNNINPPPSGPFSKCKIALNCDQPFGSGPSHCGLVIDTGDGVYLMDGSGGSVNSIWVVPGSTSDATQSFTDNDPSVCSCLFANVTSWNGLQVPRSNTCENSNWNLKCMNTKCKVQLNWGSQQTPLGYHCQECKKWTTVRSPTVGSFCACEQWGEKPCPNQ